MELVFNYFWLLSCVLLKNDTPCRNRTTWGPGKYVGCTDSRGVVGECVVQEGRWGFWTEKKYLNEGTTDLSPEG